MTRSIRTIRWGVGLAALAVAAPALAQSPPAEGRGDRKPAEARKKAPARPLGPGGVGGRGAISPVTFIMVGAVQTELKLTEAQKQKVLQVNEDFNKRRRESAQALSKAPQGIDRAALTEMIVSLRTENEAALNQALDPNQRTRLAQITLQAEGPLAVARPEVAARLNMGPDQCDAIREILDQYAEAEGRLWSGHLGRVRTTGGGTTAPPRGLKGPGPAGKDAVAPGRRDPGRADTGTLADDPSVDRVNRESAALQDEAVRQVGRTMSRKQKAAFARLLGEPFDLAKLQSGGVPRPPRPASPPTTLGTGNGPEPFLPPADSPTVLEPLDPPDQSGAAGKPGPGKGRAGRRN